MVQPIENEARIKGTVREVQPRGDEGFVDLIVDVEAVDDVEGRPNLLRAQAGQTMKVSTEAEPIAQLGLAPGDGLTIHAELRGPGAIWSRPGAVSRA